MEEKKEKESEKETGKALACASPTAVSYEADGAKIALDEKTVRDYLVRGNANCVTNGEIALFINTCMQQRLNPFVNGEVYLIKYSKEQPAQIVVGKEFYIKRAYSNPHYRGLKSGIIVSRGSDIIRKEGTCVYPGETLIGGWCRIVYENGGKECDMYKEVSLSEYSSGKSSWATKPATMINKVAMSQCARDAFPAEFEGLYSMDEMVASGAIDARYVSEELTDTGEEFVGVNEASLSEDVEESKVTKEQRQKMFEAASNIYGREDGNRLLKIELAALGLEKSSDLTVSQYEDIMRRIDSLGV